MSKANLNFDETNRELLAFLDHSPECVPRNREYVRDAKGGRLHPPV